MDQGTQESSSSPHALSAAPAGPDLSGKTFGDFRLFRRLGQGGMGQVYLAEQISLKRKVAIKIMRPDVAVSATTYQRFRAEAEAVARITHTNIVQVYTFGEEDCLHYMALEYVEGRNLRDYVARKGPPDLPLALSIMRQVAAALQRASELGIVHRDIKPENILLTRRGEVKVADFGLSRCFTDDQPASHLTQPGLTMGTPLYMSPEQIQGQAIDPRTDIYSFGVTCYHMLTGQPPFRGETALALAMQHVRMEAAPLQGLRSDLPPELCAVVHKMMAKEMDDRYQTCGDLLKDLARLRESIGGQKIPAAVTALNMAVTQPASATTMLRPLLPSRWLVTVALATVFLALVAGGVLGWLHTRSKAPLVQNVPAKAVDLPPAPTEEQKQEKFMREALEQFGDPREEPMRMQFGLQLAVDLGVFYLRHERLDDADGFFQNLRRSPPHRIGAFRVLGQLGHAIVLGRQNKAAESNKAFLELLDRPRAAKAPERLPYFLNQPQLRYEIARALDYNRMNAAPGQPLPKQLEALRVPPRWLQAPPLDPRPGAAGKK